MKLSIAYINDVHGYVEPHAELFLKTMVQKQWKQQAAMQELLL